MQSAAASAGAKHSSTSTRDESGDVGYDGGVGRLGSCENAAAVAENVTTRAMLIAENITRRDAQQQRWRRKQEFHAAAAAAAAAATTYSKQRAAAAVEQDQLGQRHDVQPARCTAVQQCIRITG